jgi:diacylglycerol kinase (ATP)
MLDLLVIAHGKRNGWFAAHMWERLARILRDVAGAPADIQFTRGPGDATVLARTAVCSGVRWIAVAGGDGTINEVLNGYCAERNRADLPPLSFLPFGSGNDWVRSLGIPRDPLRAAKALANSRLRAVDIGVARFHGRSGHPEERYFINFAEAGVGARSVQPMNALPRWGRTGMVYLATAVATAFHYSPRRLRIACDANAARETEPLLSVIVANGRFFGGGIQCAPMARLDDGLLDVVTIGSFGKLELLRKVRKFVAGRYLDESRVSHIAARLIEISGPVDFPFELDGDFVGTLPAAIKVIPRALTIRS